MELPSLSHGVSFNRCNVWLLLFTIANFISSSVSINCYKCSSRNGSDPWCEDPIDTALAPLSERCLVPKRNHRGLFLANFCVKIIGNNVATGEKLVIRACAQTSMDNQCGEFKYENAQMSGCVLTCNQNGCNHAHSVEATPNLALIISILVHLFKSPLLSFNSFKYVYL